MAGHSGLRAVTTVLGRRHGVVVAACVSFWFLFAHVTTTVAAADGKVPNNNTRALLYNTQRNIHANISELLDNLLRGYDNSVRPDFGGKVDPMY